MPWMMCEKEYGSATRWEFSLLQMFPSHKPNLPSGPSGERPIHNSTDAVRAKTAMKMATVHLWRSQKRGRAFIIRSRWRRLAPDEDGLVLLEVFLNRPDAVDEIGH